MVARAKLQIYEESPGGENDVVRGSIASIAQDSEVPEQLMGMTSETSLCLVQTMGIQSVGSLMPN